MQNYTLVDAVGTMEAIGTFALVLVPPGFLLGWTSDVFAFRRRSNSEKLLFSVVLSTATAPIIAVLAGRLVSLTAAAVFFLLLSTTALALLWNKLSLNSRLLSRVPRTTWVGLGIIALWSILAVFSLVDLQFGDRLYLSAAIFDHSVRVPLVASAARAGVPPLNPFYALGKVPILRYYYYWYVVCALPMRLVGLSARACFNASVVWSGVALASVIPLYLKHFLYETEELRRKSLIGISLLLVTGLDLIPYGLFSWASGVVPPDLEWWDPNQVTSWLGSLVWVPHHVAALTACMAGLLVLSKLDEQSGICEHTWAVLISGMAFASSAGLSLFVTFTFAIFVVLWTIILLVQGRIRNFAVYAAAGGMSVLLSVPYLLDLRTPSSFGQRFAIFAIRDFPLAIKWLRHCGVQRPALLNFAQLPVLLGVYFLELGFFFCVAVLQFRHELLSRKVLSQQRRAAWVMFTTSLIAMSTLQSDRTVTLGNDLGFRGMLVVQFVLLLWAVPIMYEGFAGQNPAAAVSLSWKSALVGTLLVGALGTITQLFMLRCYEPLVDSGRLLRAENYLGRSPALGKRTFRLRENLMRLESMTVPTSVWQYNPVSENVFMIHLYSTRQAAAGDASCGSTFGGDIKRCDQAMPYLIALFNSASDARGWDLDKFCNAFSVNLLVATEVDPVWNDPNSWVWSRRALLSTGSLRAIPCGTMTPQGGP